MPRPKNGSSGAERPKRVTLQDIADVAGVKKMVVSNALNGTRSVAPATREKVQRIAREMNYVPNFAARALTTGRTGIIAILCGRLKQPYYASMVDLLEQHIHAEGLNLLLVRTPKDVKELVNATGNIVVDGAIAVDMLGLVGEFNSTSHIPCVSIATIKRSLVDHVLVDLSVGVKEAVGLMLADGRQRVAYVVTSEFMARDAEVRARAYYEAMKEGGREPEVINVTAETPEEIETNFKIYVEANGYPDGLLCQNDETAMSVFRVLKALGHKVPSDVLLVGCDGHPHMEDFEPPLSTIVQPMEELCAKAWEFLKNRIAEPGIPHQEAVFEGKLIVRASLGKSSPEVSN